MSKIYFEKRAHPNDPMVMGRHIKLYMLGYALGLYELVLSYGLGYSTGVGSETCA